VTNVSQDVLVVLKQLSIIEPKRQQAIIGIHSNNENSAKKNAVWEKNFLALNMRQIKLK
jgi:hypothetical protein